MTSQSTSPLQKHNFLSGAAIIAAGSDLENQPTALTEHPGLETQSYADQFGSRRASSDGAPTPSLVSRDLEEQCYESRRAPTRAIYDDLSTAVSSIRSGSARGGYRSVFRQPSDIQEGQADIPLQNLQPIQRQGDNSPVPQSLGSRLSQSMNLELHTVTFPARNPVPQHQPLEPTWNPIKKTWAALSSFTRGSGSVNTPASQLPRDSSGSLEPVTQSASGPISSLFQNEENGSSARHNQHDNWPRYRKRNAQSSLQEGSTIDNIVRQYKGSDIESNAGINYSSQSQPTASFDPNLSQVSDSSFFSDLDAEDLARPPTGHRRRGQYFLEESASHPPEYDPPRLPVNGLPRSEGRTDLASADSHSGGLEFTSSELGDTNTNSNNSFKKLRNRSPTRFILNETQDAPQNSPARQPLEQVIKQLRHSSDFSTMSAAPNSTAQQHKSPERSYHTQRPQAQLERELSKVSVDEETRRLAQPILFYDQKAIDPNWSTNNHINGLRVPIKQPVCGSKRQNLGASQKTNLNADEDQEDWETVVTEPANHQAAYQRGYVGGTTSSSIGDMTDDGIFNRHQEINGFSSTERIIQHPGEIHYHGDYRQLKLKNTKVPVMAPQYLAHRVNGYAADSIRTQPPHPYYSTSSPLANPNTHLFHSQPRQVISPRSRKPTGMPRPNQGRNRFIPWSKGSSIVTDDTEVFPRARALVPKLARTKKPRPWMTAHDDVESTFSTQSSVFSGNGRQNARISWDYTTTFAKPGLNPGRNQAGSRSTPRNALPSSSDYQVSSAKADGFTEVSLYADRNLGGRPTKTVNPRHSGKDPRDHFTYRSPLAPPRRHSCRALYTKSQLGRIDLAGETAGMSRGVR